MVQTKLARQSTPFVPSLDCARRIGDSDDVFAISAAVYRAETKLAELRTHYEAEAARIRSAMLTEIAEREIGEAE